MFALTKDEIDSVSRFAFDGSGLVISDSGFHFEEQSGKPYQGFITDPCGVAVPGEGRSHMMSC
jgi:hypothetical protein